MSRDPRLTLSMTILLSELDLCERPSAAAALGFDSVESWWPWESSIASAEQVEGFAAALAASRVDLYLVNVAEGDERFGRRGLAGIPDAGDEFWANAESLLALVGRTRARYINVLAGNVTDAGSQAGIDALIGRVSTLADRAADLGAGIVVEHLNPVDHPDYLLADADLAVDVVLRIRDRSRSSNVGLLADVYHLGSSGVDPVAFVAANAPVIHHVQLADLPGRGRPGTGILPIAQTISALDEHGYAGRYGLEYLPGPNSGIPSPADFWRELRS
jgi:hydroxypyruvate isomerase